MQQLLLRLLMFAGLVANGARRLAGRLTGSLALATGMRTALLAEAWFLNNGDSLHVIHPLLSRFEHLATTSRQQSLLDDP